LEEISVEVIDMDGVKIDKIMVKAKIIVFSIRFLVFSIAKIKSDLTTEY
jgi:hypothetical protein